MSCKVAFRSHDLVLGKVQGSEESKAIELNRTGVPVLPGVHRGAYPIVRSTGA
jgi:hypothetical protein